MKKLFGLVILLLFSSLASGVYGLECGDTINESITLTEDLLNCSNNGLVIEANDITLDCDGYLIEGGYNNGGNSGAAHTTTHHAGTEAWECAVGDSGQSVVLTLTAANTTCVHPMVALQWSQSGGAGPPRASQITCEWANG